MSKSVDETEHSLEMHAPFIKKIFGDKEIQLIPVMVGNLTKLKEIQYGDILSQYFRKDKNLFVISSDFCHWGMNFDFNYYNKEDGEIY
jgi:AmmeMemoRadiSam system protein B